MFGFHWIFSAFARKIVSASGNKRNTDTAAFVSDALAAARGRVLTRNQLIDAAIGNDAMVTDRTIDVHVTSLRSKLGKSRELVETVRGVGYRLSEVASQ